MSFSFLGAQDLGGGARLKEKMLSPVMNMMNHRRLRDAQLWLMGRWKSRLEYKAGGPFCMVAAELMGWDEAPKRKYTAVLFNQ